MSLQITKALHPRVRACGARRACVSRIWNIDALALPRRGFRIVSTSQLAGSSGRIYQFKELLRDNGHLGRIWVATLVFL